MVKVWTYYVVCHAFYLQHHQHPCSINYKALAINTKQEKRRRNITPVLTKKVYYNLKTLKLDLVLIIPFSFVDLFFIYLLKLYLPLVHKIALANKFQLYHKIK